MTTALSVLPPESVYEAFRFINIVTFSLCYYRPLSSEFVYISMTLYELTIVLRPFNHTLVIKKTWHQTITLWCQMTLHTPPWGGGGSPQ